MSFLNLTAVLGMDGSGFKVGIKQAESQAQAFANQFKSYMMSAFGTYALIAYTKSVVDGASEIVNLSRRLDVSTDTLQVWKYAMTRAGGSAEEAALFFEKLSKSRDEVFTGNEELERSFRTLGVTMDMLKHNRIEDIAKTIAGTVKAGDIQALDRQLKDVGGRGAGVMVPAMKAGLEETTEAAKKAGAVLNTDILLTLQEIKLETIDWAASMRGPVANSLSFIHEMFKDTVDMFKISVGMGAAFAGSLSVQGTGWKDAAIAAKKAINEVLDARIAADRKHEEKAKELLQNKTTNAEMRSTIADEQKLGDLQRKNAEDRMSNEEKINALLMERKAIQDKGDPTIKDAIRLEEIKAGVFKASKFSPDKPNVSELQRIGALSRVASPELGELKKISGYTGEISKRVNAFPMQTTKDPWRQVQADGAGVQF